MVGGQFVDQHRRFFIFLITFNKFKIIHIIGVAELSNMIAQPAFDQMPFFSQIDTVIGMDIRGDRVKFVFLQLNHFLIAFLKLVPIQNTRNIDNQADAAIAQYCTARNAGILNRIAVQIFRNGLHHDLMFLNQIIHKQTGERFT